MDALTFSSMKNSSSQFSPLSKAKPKSRPKNTVQVVSALRSSSSYESRHPGRIVDENMIVLRKRIHEMKVVERNYEPPTEWMQWEKQIYTQYDEYICTILGMVQTQLMNTRPSVALGALAMLTLSLPSSVILLALHLAQAADHVSHHALVGTFPPPKKSSKGCVVTAPSTDDVEELELSINCTPLMPMMLKNDRNTSDKEKEHDISKPDSLIPAEFA
ncbi:hypothetical protein Cgig2_003275 [Carnegiea gigantea]|uniref:Uncharacterized protein n=1 Tax=Carnegiea gigantea TaxID=171969 RepID=A0A9Q1JLZ1_9CARY|nr:hypothetical protein Cgig2_003275 [Carnegiea gigantea]